MEQYLHKVMLRKLDFGRDRKGLVLCTKERRRFPPLIYHYCAIFCCFLIKCKYSHNLVDRISELPADVHARIVSLLPLKEAVATSALSRRWRYAWTFTVNLDFDPGNALFRLTDLKPKLLDQENRRYVHWVNSIVEQHAGSDIKKFRACFVLDHHFASSIDRWVQFAMRKRVEVLDLDFLKLRGDPAKGLYSFTSKVLGLEKSCSLNNYIGFQSLKVLHLVFVAVTGDVLEYFLSHCPVLERLSVTFACSLVNLRVVDPPSGLKYLELKHCYYLKTVQICGANLVSFSIEGHGVDLILNNVPFLVEASTSCNRCLNPNSMRQVFSQLSCCLSQLESLKLRVIDVEYNENYIFPTLANVKNLELTLCADYKWSLSQLSSFMKACPSMQRLGLKMFFPEDEEAKKIKKAAKCPHHSLRVIEVEGYIGHANVDEHVMYLIDNAVELEKILIDPVLRWAFHPTGADRKKKHFKREERARSHAMSLLKVKVPSYIEFVCL